jgi:hypothetical protein
MQAAVRDTGPKYALPLVIRVERNAPPARTDALEGAGRAVLAFLTDPRVTGAAGPGGEWAAGEWSAAPPQGRCGWSSRTSSRPEGEGPSSRL